MKIIVLISFFILFVTINPLFSQNLVENGDFDEADSATNFKANLDSVYNHNGFLLELGYSLPQFKETYTPARIPMQTYPFYHLLETKVPGFYSKNKYPPEQPHLF